MIHGSWHGIKVAYGVMCKCDMGMMYKVWSCDIYVYAMVVCDMVCWGQRWHIVW